MYLLIFNTNICFTSFQPTYKNYSCCSSLFWHLLHNRIPNWFIFSEKKLISVVISRSETPSKSPVYPPMSANKLAPEYSMWLSRTGIKVRKYMVTTESKGLLTSYVDGYPNEISMYWQDPGQLGILSPSYKSPKHNFMKW